MKKRNKINTQAKHETEERKMRKEKRGNTKTIYLYTNIPGSVTTSQVLQRQSAKAQLILKMKREKRRGR